MHLIDIHCHIDFPVLEKNIDKIIENARKADVKTIIANGVNPESNRKIIEVSKKYKEVKTALGIYPPDAFEKETSKKNPININKEIEFIEKQKPIAIGEIGLDYCTGEDKTKQKEVFIKQLELAKKLKIPAIIHSRKAELDVIEILQSINHKKVILHCFCGKKHLIKQASELGFYFSIPTNVVKAQNLQDLVKIVNINQLFAETDAPFLSPFQGKTNEPSFVVEAYKKIAEIKGFELNEVKNNIFLNFQRIF